ncbi:MAG: OsmC family protein [Fimbriimonadales bacterium]
MQPNEHHYDLTVRWTGNLGDGTSGYRSYSRDHVVNADGPPEIIASSDPAFGGDKSRWNPEQLLLAAAAQCHMLSYLYVASKAGIVVTAYEDHAEGTVVMNPDGSGQFASATLHPQVTISDSEKQELAASLHHEAGQVCFIARSVNFSIAHEPHVVVEVPT